MGSAGGKQICDFSTHFPTSPGHTDLPQLCDPASLSRQLINLRATHLPNEVGLLGFELR